MLKVTIPTPRNKYLQHLTVADPLHAEHDEHFPCRIRAVGFAWGAPQLQNPKFEAFGWVRPGPTVAVPVRRSFLLEIFQYEISTILTVQSARVVHQFDCEDPYTINDVHRHNSHNQQKNFENNKTSIVHYFFSCIKDNKTPPQWHRFVNSFSRNPKILENKCKIRLGMENKIPKHSQYRAQIPQHEELCELRQVVHSNDEASLLRHQHERTIAHSPMPIHDPAQKQHLSHSKRSEFGYAEMKSGFQDPTNK